MITAKKLECTEATVVNTKEERISSIIRGYFFAQKLLGVLFILIAVALMCVVDAHYTWIRNIGIVSLIAIGVACFTKIRILFDPRVESLIIERRNNK